MKWFAYNDFADLIVLGDRPQILNVSLPIGSAQSRPTLRGQQECVAYRDTDIPVSHVQCDDAHEIE